ncbi:MAG TPA: pilus assembly protein TadG-related protein, partial [Stellaceae bacterium]|nr:pilus assembly protein TadG-related protein [Stellaceae bacterium]
MLRRLRQCTAGAVPIALFVVVTIPITMAFASFGIETGHWYLTQREVQGAADAAAISAAAEYIS